MDPRIDFHDQLVLPVHPLHLPHPERNKGAKCKHKQQGQPPGPPRRSVGSPLRDAQGNCPISWLIGIMLWLRWYITHSEPDSAITTRITVKISAITVQPFSALVFMCRK